MTRTLLRSAALVAALPSILLATAPAAAQRTLDFHRFHSEILVRPDGSMRVTETITIEFIGTWNGLLRRIPVEYETERGANYTLRLKVTDVTSESGTPLRVEEEREGRYLVLRVYVPGAQDATHTVKLTYDVANGLRFFEQHDELYWNVTGNETEYPTRSASAVVHLPEGVTNVRATAYTGAYGSVASDASVSIQGRMVSFQTTRPLGFREGLTIVTGWDPGVVQRPTAADRARDFLLSNFPLAFPFLVLGLMLMIWRRHGRDPERLSIVPQYEPPAGVSPAEAGTLIDGTPDMRDITATIVDLAVRGYLIVEETKKEQLFGLIKTDAFAFEMKRPPEEWRELKGHERKLLKSLFDNGRRPRVETKELENEFYRDLPDIKTELSETLTRGGHYPRHPNGVRVMWVFIGIATGIALTFGGTALMAVMGRQPIAAILGGILSGFVVIVVGMAMPRRTIKGARTHEALLGFEEFLSRVEKERYDAVVLTPALFEKYLPFAMAFGVERNWAGAFDDIYREPPQWYHGSSFHHFQAHSFAGNLNRMAGVTASAMAVAPRSSSGSSGFGGGGGGGGFSGGGFGGGGSGGF